MSVEDDGVIAPTSYDASKPPEEIETDIAHTRANLSETLDALERKLAPRQLMEKGIDMFRDSMHGNGGRMGEIIRENPVPLALIGAGIGWLVLSKSGVARSAANSSYGRSVRDSVSSAASSAADYAGDMAGRVRGMIGGDSDERAGYAHARTKTEASAGVTTASHMGEDTASSSSRGTASRAMEAGSETWRTARHYAGSATGRAREYGQRAWETASDYAGSAGAQAGRTRDRIGQLIEDYPLAVGAFGFLAGALVAAALPSTRIEDEWVGDTRDDLWREAEERGRDAMDRATRVASTALGAAGEAVSEAAREVVDRTKDAAQSEAERQHLTPEAAKEEVKKTAEAASRSTGSTYGTGSSQGAGSSQGPSHATSGSKPGSPTPTTPAATGASATDPTRGAKPV